MQNNVEIIQINISGEDKPGMTSSLTEILARYDAFILDIGQANIHQSLTLGILFRTTSDKSGNIMKELLFKASELGVMIRFTPIPEDRYNDWVGRQGKNRYIITLLGRTVTARHIAQVTKVVAEHGLNIDAIKRLTGRMPLCEDDRAAKSCIELSVRGSLTDQERSTMQEGFMNLSEIGLDVSFQKDDIYRRSRRLICFDMDSTLIETEVIDELAERAGVGGKVREITASAMRGEIDFRESFSRRVALLKGLDVSVMDEIARSLPITEGLERMMTILKRVGYKTAILSGGFTYFGNYLRQKYGFDYVYANELEIEQGKPRNPFINAGALVVCDMLQSRLSAPRQRMLEIVRRLSGVADIAYDPVVARSEFEHSARNAAIAWLMKSFGNFHNDVATVLQNYFHYCSLEMSCVELARTFLFLADRGIAPHLEAPVIAPIQSRQVNALMMTSGMYQNAGEFAWRVGLPAKSGVGGGIVAIVPQEMAIAVWSPELDDAGNSLAGVALLEKLTQRMGRSVF